MSRTTVTPDCTIDEYLSAQRAKLQFLINVFHMTKTGTIPDALSSDDAIEGLGYILVDVSESLRVLLEALPGGIGQFTIGDSPEHLVGALRATPESTGRR